MCPGEARSLACPFHAAYKQDHACLNASSLLSAASKLNCPASPDRTPACGWLPRSIVADKPGCACRVDAGKVELDGARYLNFNLPFSISQLVWIEAILVGGAEIYRNRELDPEARIYPGALSLQALLHCC